MASINTYYIGLTRQAKTLSTVETTTKTLADYANDIATAESLNLNYYIISLERNPSFNSLTYPSETLSQIETALGITLVDGDVFITTPFQTNLTKELKQIQKLDIAAAKRGEAYDINKLPTKYSSNTLVDNANTGGLQERRPWVLDYTRTTSGMILWLDAADTDSYPGTGTTWTDLISPANNFTFYNTPTWNSQGYFDFDPSSSEYAAINHTADLKPTAGLTTEQWLNADDWEAGTSGAYFTALSCTQGGGYAHYIWGGEFVPYVYVVNLSNYLKPTASVAGFTGWHHFATTFDGRYARLYIDGELASTADAGANTTISYDPDNDVCIGAEAGTLSTPQGFYWDGKIATTAIYNRALTAAEVLRNYNSDKSRFGL